MLGSHGPGGACVGPSVSRTRLGQHEYNALSAEREYAVSYSRTTTGSSKNESTAEIKLATSTPGTCISGQLAVDTMFDVYIVSSTVFPCATLQ